MPQPLFKLYGAIQKVEDNDDGTLTVYGIASSGARDSAGEIVAPEAMKAALPDYSKFPALREMHQPIAAGKVTEAEVDEEGITHIAALVVDPVAIVKVRTGVYAGFSIGGKVLSRDPQDRSIITGLKLVELSLVDSPCNPDAVLTMWKADMTDFKPASADVIERAKKLAKAAGTQRFKDFLFEAGQELMSEHLLEKGELEPPPEVIEAAATIEPAAAPSAAAPEAIVEAEPEAVVAEPKEAAAAAGDPEPDEGDGAGEGAGDPDEPEAKEAAEAIDPAAALADAIGKAKEKIEAAAPAPEPVADPFADFGKAAAALLSIDVKSDLAKGLYSVSRLAELLQSFAFLQEGAACEAEYEGDDSPIPAQLAEQVKAIGGILVAMAQEEVAELLAEIAGEDDAEIIYVGDEIVLAQQIVDLVKADEALMEKAGARHNKADAEHIQKAHDHLAKLGAACAKGDDAEMVNRVAELELERDGLKKSLEDAAPAVDDLTKGFGETIEGFKTEIAELRKRFEDEPAPLKTAGPAAVRPIQKGNDSIGGEGGENAMLPPVTADEFQKLLDQLPEAERGNVLVRIALANPSVIALPR